MYRKEGPQVIKCFVEEVSNELYNKVVIRDLNENKYLIVTIFPNWQGLIPKKGDTGFLQFEFVQAGKTQWYDKQASAHNFYLNTSFIFKEFVKETILPQNEKIVL